MSFIQASIINHTNTIESQPLDSGDMKILSDESGSAEMRKYEIYKQNQKKHADLVLEYNYIRFLNANISLAIISLLYFNYELVNLESS